MNREARVRSAFTFSVILAFILLPGGCGGGSSGTGGGGGVRTLRVDGRLRTETGMDVPGAEVRTPSTGEAVLSDETGRFQLGALLENGVVDLEFEVGAISDRVSVADVPAETAVLSAEFEVDTRQQAVSVKTVEFTEDDRSDDDDDDEEEDGGNDAPQAVPTSSTGEVCTPSCGDGICHISVCPEAGCPCRESTNSCPSDCESTCRDKCGDGTCTRSVECQGTDCICAESAGNCPTDCMPSPTPFTTPTPELSPTPTPTSSRTPSATPTPPDACVDDCGGEEDPPPSL